MEGQERVGEMEGYPLNIHRGYTGLPAHNVHTVCNLQFSVLAS